MVLLKSEDYFKKSLSIKENTIGIKHPDYLASLLNLGVLYKESKNYSEAESNINLVLKTFKEILEPGHVSIGVAQSH